MCFKRIKYFLYMDNTLPWVTYNNLRANKTSILHALVKILGDFLRVRRITTCTSVRSMRLQFKVVGHCIAEYIRCLYAIDIITFARHFICFTVMTVYSDLWD